MTISTQPVWNHPFWNEPVWTQPVCFKLLSHLSKQLDSFYSHACSLIPEAEGGLKQPFIYVQGDTEYENAVSDLKEKLKQEGYVILRNPRRLYVVELNPSRNTPKNAVGSVYVGQTSFPVEERIKQHRLGPKYPWKGKAKHSPRCHKRFVQPRLDLIPNQFKCIYGSLEEALVSESNLRIHFESIGYEVIGGTERYEQQEVCQEV